MPDSREYGLERVGRPDTLPVLRREIVKDQQLLTILLQAQRRLRVLRLIGPDEQGKGPLGLFLGVDLPDLMQRLLGLGCADYSGPKIRDTGLSCYPRRIMA